MIDAVVAGFGAVGLLCGSAAVRHLRRVRESDRLLDRLQPYDAVQKSSERGPLLQGLADRIAATAPGARLRAHAASHHPSVLFSDYVAIALGSILGAGLLAALITGRPIALACGVLAPLLVDRAATRVHGNRSARIERQLPDALSLQAGALRAGQSLVHSLRIMAGEVKAPLGEEIGRMLQEVDLGQPLDGALGELSARVGSRDFDLWVTSMLIHRQTGGNLAGVIDTLAGRVSQRIRLRSEIKAMTAQGRLSGIVVALAPLTFFTLLSVGSKEQMEFLYSTPTGWALLGSGLTLNGLGFWWIRWALKVRV